VEEVLPLLRAAQRDLRLRFDDFRQALDRRDGPAYRLALSDFQRAFTGWSAAQEGALLPALDRAAIEGRDSRRELTLEFVQVRELTRHVRMQIEAGAPLSDILGLVENLTRRLDAHERSVQDVYYPSAAPLLTTAERQALEQAARAL
jgi:hypothetical protein